jgi:hypothetical protein
MKGMPNTLCRAEIIFVVAVQPWRSRELIGIHHIAEVRPSRPSAMLRCSVAAPALRLGAGRALAECRSKLPRDGNNSRFLRVFVCYGRAPTAWPASLVLMQQDRKRENFAIRMLPHLQAAHNLAR